MSEETKQTPTGSAETELGERVEDRFGVLPNFFRLAPETPEITEKLWGFAQAAYLDNPLHSVFKERLFVHLSRFCAVRYCIARHVGFLVGLGRPAGDPNVRAQNVQDVVKLLRRPFPRGPELASHLSLCANCPAPLAEMPGSDSELDGVITTWNAGAERLFGYAASEAVGQHISLIIPHNRLNEETTILEKIKQGQRIEHFDTVRVRKDGSTLDISLTISPVRDATGKIVGASKIARDITQRRKIERALRESEERYRTLADALDTQVQFRTQEVQRRNEEIVRQADQLRELSGFMLKAQDEERRRLARDLHDSAGQTLVVMSIKLAQMAEAKSDPAQLANMIQEVEELVQGLTQEIRTTSYLLYPPMLDEGGLSYALRWYVEGLVERSGLEIDLKIPDSFERLSREMELVIFRVVQECLTNIHRHSGSKTASIRIERQHENVQVTVQDSGKGMSAEKLAEIQSQGKGVGLRGMRERVRNLQGELTIESSGGTKVSAILPAKKSILTDHSETQERGAA